MKDIFLLLILEFVLMVYLFVYIEVGVMEVVDVFFFIILGGSGNGAPGQSDGG